MQKPTSRAEADLGPDGPQPMQNLRPAVDSCCQKLRFFGVLSQRVCPRHRLKQQTKASSARKAKIAGPCWARGSAPEGHRRLDLHTHPYDKRGNNCPNHQTSCLWQGMKPQTLNRVLSAKPTSTLELHKSKRSHFVVMATQSCIHSLTMHDDPQIDVAQAGAPFYALRTFQDQWSGK